MSSRLLVPSMRISSPEGERRQSKRHKVDNVSCFTVSPHCPALGPIIDISFGGLAFCYEGKALSGIKSVDIYFGNDLFCIKNIPCIGLVVKDLPYSAGQCHGASKRASIQFGSLTPAQKKQLSYLIQMSSSKPEDLLADFFGEFS